MSIEWDVKWCPVSKCPLARNSQYHWISIDWLFFTPAAISYMVGYVILKFPWRPSLAYSFSKSTGNGLLRDKAVVILDTGHHLTSHSIDIKNIG